MISEDCPIVEKDQFLKKICTEEHGYTIYKCHNSNSYYVAKPIMDLYSIFDHICEMDPLFYQSCGAGNIAGNGADNDQLTSNNKTLCGDYICELPPTTDRYLSMFYIQM